MSQHALSVVWSPNLLRADVDDFAMIMANMPAAHRVVNALITHVSLGMLYASLVSNHACVVPLRL
jgi:hypothetical protein